MVYSAAVITISDKGSQGLREDTSGPALCRLLEENDWQVEYKSIVPDEAEAIKRELEICSDEKKIALIVTTGGTGLSPRDITPEVTGEVIEKAVPGIPEAMRAKSMQITDRGCLSRGLAGIRKQSLIVNLPGSKKASVENLETVIKPIKHGIEMLLGSGSANCAAQNGTVISVCISTEKGTQKKPIEKAELIPDHGIKGDAHAGNWHRQVSLLGTNSVKKAQAELDFTLKPGDFAENILIEGMVLYELPVGSRIMIGSALCEVTQIGKECHHDCAIRQKTGDCVMPREGIFVKVLKGGVVKAGDLVSTVA